MELKPNDPPGHARRKLRGLVSEIARLRDEGYTIGAIHQALTDAGIEVGWASVQREVARLKRLPQAALQSRQPATRQRGTRDVEQAAASPALSKPAADVESFFDQHTTNPLFKKKGSKG